MPCLREKEEKRSRVGSDERGLLRQKTEPNSSSGSRDGDEVFVIKMSSLDIDIERVAFQREHQESNVQRAEKKNKRISLPTNMEPCLSRAGSDEKKSEFQFSLWQSTVLYSMFLYNAILIGSVDIVIQIVNMGYNHCKRKGVECKVEDGEQMTVVDILKKVDPINQAYAVILITNIAAFVSFAINVKKEKGRISCLSSTFCKFMQEAINDW